MRRALLGFIVLSAGICPALADAIDGDWCGEGGKHFKIIGPTIEYGPGVSLSGDYDRHGFRYVVPAGEPGAGSEVLMDLQGEHLLHVRRGAGPVEEWRRCSTVS